MTTPSTEHKCPSCGSPLIIEVGGVGWIVYCNSGACSSPSANDGEGADTLEEALLRLEKAVRSEELSK